MRIYGDIEMNQNEVRRMAFQSEADFPTNPTLGQMLFRAAILYICVEISPLAVWVPLTQTLTSKVFDVPIASTTWTLTHDFNSPALVVQAYDMQNHMIFPNTVDLSDPNSTILTYAEPVAGKAICMLGSYSTSTGGGGTAPQSTFAMTRPNLLDDPNYWLAY